MVDKQIGRPRTIDPDVVSLTALRLFDTRGYDAVSMEDVASETGVSRRYLFRLFPSKASLVWGGFDDFIDRLRHALEETGTDVSALRAVEGAYRRAATFPAVSVETTRHRLRVIAANPRLGTEGAGRIAEATAHVTEFVAARAGRTSEDLGVVTIAASLAAAVSAALTWWALHSDEPPQDVVLRALQMVVPGSAERDELFPSGGECPSQ